ncbi:hypothetical protein AAFF_G00193440 [Aldrovandia affinis]|uniref:Reverse transcriptase/retrotransposon-derived protein RNase H-like domain-containing protein n=1 Tax=Aldrovandia affinis TaxID=143900 RepID=A0AAD7SXF3_9TELE|nr:hypothetical protein AAFF_G00193440 [Aldrovandia affinis]
MELGSECKAEHLSHLRALFECLNQYSLIVNPAKCQFRLPFIDFLGHYITKDGATPLPSKPRTTKALQEFLGMVNFYHRFVPHAANLMRPLFGALKGKSPNHTIDWTADMGKAVTDTKPTLANATMLAHPLPSAPIALTTDASDYAVGVVHEHLYLAVRHLRFLLEGRQFTAFIYHKALAFAMFKIAEPWSARQQRHLTYI